MLEFFTILMNTPNDLDISREWITPSKIIQFFRIIFQTSTTKVFSYHRSFSEINFEYLQKQWIQWIILDTDDCIAQHHGDILPENKEIIEKLVTWWWKIAIFSNMKKNARYSELEKLWIQVITSAYAKPDPRGFEQSLIALWLKKEAVVCIWDNFLTDGWSINVWIAFIKVSPIRSDIQRSMNRRIQIAIQDGIDMIAKIRWHTL